MRLQGGRMNLWTRRTEGTLPRRRRTMVAIGVAAVAIASLASFAISAQDVADAKYNLKVPGGLAFAEFKGYETWQTISISRTERLVGVIVGNPEMIAAYRAGIPANGKPV